MGRRTSPHLQNPYLKMPLDTGLIHIPRTGTVRFSVTVHFKRQSRLRLHILILLEGVYIPAFEGGRMDGGDALLQTKMT